MTHISRIESTPRITGPALTVCPICLHNGDEILLPKKIGTEEEWQADQPRLLSSGPCRDCKSKLEDYVALIPIDPSKAKNDHVSQEDFINSRTSNEMVWIKIEVFERMTGTPAPAQGVCAVEPSVIDFLKDQNDQLTPPPVSE